MKKKLLLTVILSLSVLSGLFAGGKSQAASQPADEAKEVLIWFWDNSDRRWDSYHQVEAATGLKISQTVVLAKDMVQKLQTAMASNGEMPDLAALEATYLGKLLSLDIWEDITAAPYNVDVSKVVDHVVQLCTSPKGKVVGLENPVGSGMAYKRDLAKQYFGTDDPAELEKMFPTWDACKKAGAEVQRKSGGKVLRMSSLGFVLNLMKGQTSAPFFLNGKPNLEASMGPILQELIDFKRSSVVDILDNDSPQEGASYADNAHIFYPCASWSVVYSIQANDPNGKGRWGFMLPPGGAFPWGGTVLAVPTRAKHKAAAVDYVKFYHVSEPGAVLCRDLMGSYTSYKPVYDIPNFFTGPDEFFAGQDIRQIFAQKIFPNIKKVRLPDEYDQDMADEFNLVIKRINAGENVTANDLVKQVKDDFINKYPSLR
jgi:multiple sugar transport system substrate-binding protein